MIVFTENVLYFSTERMKKLYMDTVEYIKSEYTLLVSKIIFIILLGYTA